VNSLDLLDLIIVAVIVLGAWNGYRTGLFRQVTRLFGAVIAYFISLWLRPYLAPVVATFLHGSRWNPPDAGMFKFFLGDLSGAIAFAGVFIVTFILLRYAAGLVDALFRLPVLSAVNRLLGLIAGIVFAMLFVYVATLIAHYFTNDRVQAQLNNSVIVQWLDTKPFTANQHNGGI
jgi:uncharacterized membrane protein required for colicin V production